MVSAFRWADFGGPFAHSYAALSRRFNPASLGSRIELHSKFPFAETLAEARIDRTLALLLRHLFLIPSTRISLSACNPPVSDFLDTVRKLRNFNAAKRIQEVNLSRVVVLGFENGMYGSCLGTSSFSYN
jgi:hypothetical protein